MAFRSDSIVAALVQLHALVMILHWHEYEVVRICLSSSFSSAVGLRSFSFQKSCVTFRHKRGLGPASDADSCFDHSLHPLIRVGGHWWSNSTKKRFHCNTQCALLICTFLNGACAWSQFRRHPYSNQRIMNCKWKFFPSRSVVPFIQEATDLFVCHLW